ncbi:hypothetical protein ACH4E7_03965 [Kitasatospora sp. NPDC018058]|uniref:hypothetical protein n=1 Tax=Kitasatospora sp. NPDC018058 TaxID=3364025 RepID=UPI0037BE5BFB
MTVPQRRRLAAAFAAAGITLGAAACSSSTGSTTGGGGALSYDRVRSTALDLVKNKSTSCPFGLDLAKAASGAGIAGAVAPAPADGRSVRGDAGDGVPATNGQPATPPHAQITCSYTVGPSTVVDIDLLAVPQNDYAVSMMLPSIQAAGLLSVDQLSRFSTDRPAVGQTRITPDKGTAAVARVAVKGEGDLVLMLSQDFRDSDPDPALTGEPLRKAAEALAAQLH